VSYWCRLFASEAVATGIIMFAIAATPDGMRLGAAQAPERFGKPYSP
jgi:hypothetical protein